MERTSDFGSNYNNYNNFNSNQNFSSFDNQFDTSSMYESQMISPVMQYEQAYMYYRYLTQQMEYKIKCKEFEKINTKNA